MMMNSARHSGGADVSGIASLVGVLAFVLLMIAMTREPEVTALAVAAVSTGVTRGAVLYSGTYSGAPPPPPPPPDRQNWTTGPLRRTYVDVEPVG